MRLDELLALWRETRAPEVAELVDRLSPRLAKPLFPKTASFDEKQKRWLAALREATSPALTFSSESPVAPRQTRAPSATSLALTFSSESPVAPRQTRAPSATSPALTLSSESPVAPRQTRATSTSPALTLSSKSPVVPRQTLATSTSTTPPALATVLDALHDGHSRDVAARLEQLDALPADPRIASALVRAFEQPTHLNVSTMFLWEALSRAVVRRAEPRSLARLDRVAALGAGWAGVFRPHMRPLIGAVLERTRMGLTRALTKKAWRVLTDAERAKLGAAAPAAGKDEALAAVWEAPDDLTRRLVYADMLTADGDPRGEFISLQCADTLSTTQRRRVAALLKAHGARWAAPLGKVCKVDAFERGFPAVVTLTARSRLAFGPLLGHPAWNTVHTISVGPFLEPLLHPAMTRVRCVREVSSSDLRSLGKHAGRFPFRVVVCRFAEAVAAFHVLGRRELFPDLVEVRVEQQRALDARETAQLTKLREARPEVKVRFGRR